MVDKITSIHLHIPAFVINMFTIFNKICIYGPNSGMFSIVMHTRALVSLLFYTGVKLVSQAKKEHRLKRR
jgi:hypothetical protein